MNAPREVFLDRMVARFGRERWNEHLKLIAGFLNSLSLAFFAGALVAPFVSGVSMGWPTTPGLLIMAGLCHLAAHGVMRYFKGKD